VKLRNRHGRPRGAPRCASAGRCRSVGDRDVKTEDHEITRLIDRFIAVAGGYLGLPERFSYRTHSDLVMRSHSTLVKCHLSATPGSREQ
jgi:hypothetical protein